MRFDYPVLPLEAHYLSATALRGDTRRGGATPVAAQPGFHVGTAARQSLHYFDALVNMASVRCSSQLRGGLLHVQLRSVDAFRPRGR